MTAVETRLPIRVMVTEVWDQVSFAVSPTTTVADLKRRALSQALKRRTISDQDYVVKFLGAQVLDARTLELVKTISTGHGAYNVEPSPDGRWVIATNKKEQSVSLIDAATLTEVARIPTTKPFPHGVAYAPDGRYAFVSQESKGVDPGAVNVIDLQTRTSVASIAVPLQPTGITILPRP